MAWSKAWCKKLVMQEMSGAKRLRVYIRDKEEF